MSYLSDKKAAIFREIAELHRFIARLERNGAREQAEIQRNNLQRAQERLADVEQEIANSSR